MLHSLPCADQLEPIELDGASLRYAARWQSVSCADRWLAALRAEIPWATHRVRIYGRWLDSPRLSSWHGDPEASYGYSGSRHQPLPWTPTLSAIRAALRDSVGEDFNGVLANRYRDGRDSMGWHADNERELGPRPLIASVSLGAVRRFSLKHRHSDQTLKLELAHGSLLLMAGETQRHWQHALPKEPRVREERINLTFRQILPNLQPVP